MIYLKVLIYREHHQGHSHGEYILFIYIHRQTESMSGLFRSVPSCKSVCDVLVGALCTTRECDICLFLLCPLVCLLCSY